MRRKWDLAREDVDAQTTTSEITALEDWHVAAIAEGIAAADAGEGIEHSEVWALWDMKLRARLR